MDVFQRLDQAEVVVEPFPYLVVENVLDRELCETLIDEIPPLNVLTCGAASDSNKRFTLSQQEALTDPRISKTWRDVLTQGLSQSFADRVLKLFAPHIRRELVDFEQRFGSGEFEDLIVVEQAGEAALAEVEQALALGCKLLKFFPAEAAGGVNMLKSLAGPYAHTGVNFIPTGGVTSANLGAYLKVPVVAAIGGSWMVDKSLVNGGRWSEITRLTKDALEAASAVMAAS